MKSFIDFRKFDVVAVDDVSVRFTEWHHDLIRLIDRNLFFEVFEKISAFLSSFDEELVFRLTGQQLDDQLTFCSQYKFTLIQVRDELLQYREKIERLFELWYAVKYVEVQKELLAEQKKEVEDGLRTKGAYGKTTGDDVKNRLLYKHRDEWLRWQNFIADVNRSHKFVANMASDLESRAFALMSISRTRSSY